MTQIDTRFQILVVEDDPATREFFVDLLDLEGYQPLVAATGHAALTTVADHTVDLIMLDLRLPDMSGIELCKHLRTTRAAQLPMILLTADHNPDIAQHADEAGITARLNKPVDADCLLYQIKTLLLAAAQSRQDALASAE